VRVAASASSKGNSAQFQGTFNKALEINLDPSIYGSFAEIGAGQEVARWFFLVGAAAGTVAKSISAYDMTISDSFYGQCSRYVTQERLESMLEYEYLQCSIPLKNARGANTCFFAFADTVVARAYGRNNECHGWLGVKWQTKPGAAPSRLMVHVRLLDATAVEQQEALGVFGVNFLHTAFYKYKEIADSVQTCKEAIPSLIDELSSARVEVDLIHVDGPDFAKVDNRVLALQLVDVGLTEAVFFNAAGQVAIPSDYLRKKNIIIQRGNFYPPTILNNDMLAASASEILCREDSMDEIDVCLNDDGTRVLLELTLRDLRDSGDGLDWTEPKEEFVKRQARDFLSRVDTITAMGYPVLVSSYFEYFMLAGYLRRVTKESIVIAMGLPAVKELFNPSYYEHLEGGILENFGRLITAGLKIYVYPMLSNGKILTVEDIKLSEKTQPLFDFMYKNGSIVDISNYDTDVLELVGDKSASGTALRLLREGDPAWEKFVTGEVASTIKKGSLFGLKSKKSVEAAA